MLPDSVLISGGGGAGLDGSGATVIVNPGSSTTDPAYVTFRKASYATGARGGPTASYPRSVTMQATVTRAGNATRLLESATSEARPLSRGAIKIETAEDPAIYLESNLASDDLVDHGGRTYTIDGTTIPESGSYFTMAAITA